MEVETLLAEKLAQKFLTDAQTVEKYKFIVDSEFFGRCISNRYGQLIYANQSYLDMVGADSQEDVFGNKWQDVIAPENRERVIKGWEFFLTQRLHKFWTKLKYINLKTQEIFEKKVIMSIIHDNGYSISIMPLDFDVPAEFLEVSFP